MNVQSAIPLTVLVVEDSPDDARMMLHRLRQAGFAPQAQVVETELDYVAALDTKLDVILCDHRLPRFGSERALELLKARGLEIPFILVSGTISDELAARAIGNGATDYVLKENLGRLGVAVMRGLERSRLRAEQRAMRSEHDNLAAIVESSSDAIISRDFAGTILSWNPAAERLFDWSAAEAVGRDISLIIPPELEAEVAERRTRGAEVALTPEIDTVRLTREGRRIDVSRTLSPVRDERGEVVAISLNYRDISRRKAAERAVARQGTFMTLAAALAAQTSAAATPLEALEGCLELIREHGGWRVGHLVTFGEGPDSLLPAASVWRMSEADRAALVDFTGLSDSMDFRSRRGQFIGTILRGRQAAWMEDLRTLDSRPRLRILAAHGMHSGFGFPVLVGGEVAAMLEFFGAGPRAADTLLMENVPNIAAQLGRLSERTQTHAKLAENERQLRLITEHLPAMIGYFDHELRCRFANSAFCRLHGIAPERVLGRRLDEIVDPSIYQVNREGVEQAQQGQANTTRREHRAADGSVRHLEIRRVPDLGADGALRGYYAMVLDVTDRVQAEQKIIASEARLRAILDSGPECVKVIAADGTLLEMNRAGLEMLEAEEFEQVRARGLPEFVVPEHRERFAEHFRQTLAGAASCFEFEIVGRRGTRRWMESHATALVLPGSGQPSVLAITRDITERRRAEAQVEFLSQHDRLTGLPNRSLFRDRLDFAVAHARRRAEALGVMVVDLDRFGKVNEALGTDAGDELLKAVAQRLRSALRDVDTVARLAGDEFGVLVEGLSREDAVAGVAEKLLAAFALPFELRGQEVFVRASVGIAAFPAGSTGEALLENAAIALQRVKSDGGGTYQVYAEQSAAERRGRLTVESRLRRAVEDGELEVHYQPKVKLETGEIVGAEALLRWPSPQLGTVSPAEFIPIAEETGLILAIGGEALRTACRQAAAWHAADRRIGIAVNLSPRQFRQRDLSRLVQASLAASGLPAQYLQLEITEGTAMSDPQHTALVLAELRELGVEIAVDDFGTGYSSLAYLKRFPLDCLKIDRAFVRDLLRDSSDEAIVRATLALAHSLRLRVVAEGIETEQQHALLKQLRCDEGQGYHYSPAVPAERFSALLERPWLARAPRHPTGSPRPSAADRRSPRSRSR